MAHCLNTADVTSPFFGPQEVQALLLLAKVHQARGKKDDAHGALLRARTAQEGVLAKTRLEQPDTVRAQKQVWVPVKFQSQSAIFSLESGASNL